MGQEEKENTIVQISKKKKRYYLLNIISDYLRTNIALMEYYKAVATTRKQKLTCTKNIKTTQNALSRIYTFDHIEILEYIYSMFLGNNIIAYSISGGLVMSKKLQEYDTDEGFIEFQEMIKELQEKAKAKEESQKQQIEAVKKAKEEGKKVEMVYDPKTKTTKPLIVDDIENKA